VVGHRCEQEIAAEAAVQRLEVERGDRRLRNRIRLGLPPGGADQLGHEALVEVRVAGRVALGQRMLQHLERLREPP
jgi:hypothetical protein